MSWNYRRNNSWRTPIIKRRKNGQWVAISSDDGGSDGGDGGDSDIPSRFYTDRPSERSGDTIIYDGTNYASLQVAHDELSSGDTLFIDSSNNPYVERLQVTTDNITIESDGAWLEQPDDSSSSWTIRIGENQSGGYGFHSADTSLDGSHSGGGLEEDGNTDDVGDTRINVVDASPFSVGDDIFIEEDRRPFGEAKIGDASGAEITHEYKTITDVIDSTTIEVHHPLFLPYPNNNETAVGKMNWVVEDVHLTGVNLRGLDSDSTNTPLQVLGSRDIWIETIEIEQGHDECISSTWSYNTRLNNIKMRNSNDYGVNIQRSSTQTYISNVVGDGIGAYTVRFGPGGGRGANSVDGRVENIIGRNFSNTGPVANAHWGGFYVNWIEFDGQPAVTAESQKAIRLRSRHLTLDGFEKIGGLSPDIIFAQAPVDCVIRNGTLHSLDSSRGPVFRWRLRDEGDVVNDAEYFENITIENIDIEQYGSTPITDIGHFEGNQGGDGLHFKNITYGGQQLTESDVRSWNGWDNVNITNLTVE